MKATFSQKTSPAKLQLSPVDILELQFFLNGISTVNRALSGTVASWQLKNQKKLKRILEKLFAEDKAVDDKYCDKTESGLYKVWDKIDGGFSCLMKLLPDGKTIFLDNEEKEMPGFEKEMYFYVSDLEKRAEYEKIKGDFSTTKREVSMVQIRKSLLEDVNLLTQGSPNPGGMAKKMNMELFYKTLVIGGEMEDKEDEEEDEEA